MMTEKQKICVVDAMNMIKQLTKEEKELFIERVENDSESKRLCFNYVNSLQDLLSAGRKAAANRLIEMRIFQSSRLDLVHQFLREIFEKNGTEEIPVAPEDTTKSKHYGGKDGYFTEEDVEDIIDKGGARWTKGVQDRIYLRNLVYTVGKLHISRYNTGNISSAYIYDDEGKQKISNGEARRILFAIDDAYLDLRTGHLSISGYDSCVLGNIEDYINNMRKSTELLG